MEKKTTKGEGNPKEKKTQSKRTKGGFINLSEKGGAPCQKGRGSAEGHRKGQDKPEEQGESLKRKRDENKKLVQFSKGKNRQIVAARRRKS